MTTNDLRTIEAKVQAPRRLSRDDGLVLFASDDLLAIGRLADRVRERRHGRRTYYVANTHVNYTNICVNQCRFCAFGKEATDPEGYLLDVEEIVGRAAPDVAAGATEIHIVGGLHANVDLDYYLEMVGALRAAFPDLCIQALTAVEVAYAAQKAGLAIRETLRRLKEAGLTGLPGGGAEVFDPAVRRRICPNKIGAEVWLEVHRQAHGLGLPTNATMLFGHVESAAHRVDHLLALRELQDETGGFAAFIPLSFHPQGTKFAHLPGPTAYDDLKTMAVGRLLLDNFDHIKAFWIMLGTDLAQVALRFGADDLDGTVVREEITHAAGARTPQRLNTIRLRHLVSAGGGIPVERDTLYRPILRKGGTSQWTRGAS